MIVKPIAVPDHVIVEEGNDALSGTPPTILQGNEKYCFNPSIIYAMRLLMRFISFKERGWLFKASALQ